MNPRDPAICLYFQVHQPYRLIEYDFFRIGEHARYENVSLNAEVLGKVSDRCYLPATKLFHQLIEETEGRFRFALSFSGIVLEQLESVRPDVLEAFQDLVGTGRVEILGETYHHSLASLFSKDEFRYQILKHREIIRRHFGITPTVFRNTELIYSDEISLQMEELGFRGILAEGVTWLLAPKSPNHVWTPSRGGALRLLLRNAGLSDDFAFRFSDASWKEHPVTPKKALGWIQGSGGEVVNLFMDYESLGEHQNQDSGIFKFWEGFVREAVASGIPFLHPSEGIAAHAPIGEYHCPRVTSWADLERDLSAWLGGPMQEEAATKTYAMEEEVLESNDEQLIKDWRRLQTSDHLHYMSTKGGTDGGVHDHFRPYDSPYNAYIYFMNALADLQIRVDRSRQHEALVPATS